MIVLIGAADCVCKKTQSEKDEISKVALSSQSDSVPDIALGGRAFGTSFSIKIFSKKKGSTDIQNIIQAKLEEVDRIFSNWRKDSEISRFNRHRSLLPFNVSPAFITVSKSAQKIYQLSQGAFDPAQGELFTLWREMRERQALGIKAFTHAKQDSPFTLADPREIQKISERSGMRFLSIFTKSRQLKKLRPMLQLNFSAIAKGYGVDQIAELLHQRGFASFMVEIGGELRVTHKKSKGRPWRIAIEKPEYRKKTSQSINFFFRQDSDANSQRKFYEVALLENQAMASSGDYRNYFIAPSGRLYSHILDPRSAAPVKSPILASTVIGPSCMLADALATSLMVLNLEKGREMIEKLPAYEALWIIATTQKNVYQHRLSSGMSRYLDIK